MRERNATATELPTDPDELLEQLSSSSWISIQDAVEAAGKWLRTIPPGHPRLEAITDRLVSLATHSKWEIRRGVAQTAAHTRHEAFQVVLGKLASDENNLVRKAALHAIARRRDWAHADALGKQRAQHINATLDDIEARFGSRGRTAVKRAAEHISNTFAREFYHEIIKLISPLSASVERLGNLVSSEGTPIVEEARRIDERLRRLQAVIEAMRSFAAQPKLTFRSEPLKKILDDTVTLVCDGNRETPVPEILLDVQPDLCVDLDRTRIVQAFTNILQNAVEAYAGLSNRAPILIRAAADSDQSVTITIADAGCGMSEEATRDAPALYSTSKPTGTGFGLPLAMKIIETEHRGQLTLESAKGAGTTVRLILPRKHDSDDGQG